MSAGRAVRELTRTALDPDGPGTLDDLARVIGCATGSQGAVLWEAPGEMRGSDTLSVVAAWLGGSSPEVLGVACAADPVTELAFRISSLAVPEDLERPAARVYGRGVVAAMPLTYSDGGRGVLTLLGAGQLTAAAFDTAVELVEILPELGSSIRERQTLALVNACNTILHDADVESPELPLCRERLGKHLSGMCALVADGLRCAEVSIFIEDHSCPDGGWQKLASSGGGAADVADTVTGEPRDLVRSGAGAGAEPLMEVRLLSGDHVIGLIRCRGTSGPPHHFTTSDLALLRPIAAQVSGYWRNWQHRCDIRDENESWRRLASGMLSSNKLMAAGLGDPTRNGEQTQRMAEMAVRVVHEVVAESTGGMLLRAPATARTGPTPVTSVGAGYRHGAAPASGSVSHVLRTQEQLSVTDAAALADEGIAPDIDWLLCTPICFGDQVYGVLEAAGPGAGPPPNSEQVHAIISDQLALYRHLQDALGDLHDTRRELESTLSSKADAMEDLKHQLASPLRAAVNRTDRVLRIGQFDGRAEASLRAIRGLCRKAVRVAMAAGVFAALSRGEELDPKPERLGVEDLVRLLIEAAADAQVLCDPGRALRFDVDRRSVRGLGRRLVMVDASFLQQCVGNLLDNAAKYSYDGTEVRIDADMSATWLTVGVRSSGHPMTPRDVARCRERNWRGDAARHNVGEGSGLGLWIADRLMNSMKGRLSVHAVADVTTVRLALPLS